MKTFLVYSHLISACIAVGAILLQDLELWKNKNKPLSTALVADLQRAQSTITWTLVLLWISGIALVAQGYLMKPDLYLTNEKLWVKLVVVVVLTINGFILHKVTLPKLKAGVVISEMPGSDSTPLTLTGCVSVVSWLYACFLGIARPWNYTLEFGVIVGIYLAILAAACIIGLQMMRMQRSTPGTATQAG